MSSYSVPDLLFTPEELQAVSEKRFFEIRLGVEQKLLELFGKLRTALAGVSVPYAPLYPAGTDYRTGKISKGENYNGFPYRVLDFPRLFTPANIFACRAMLLWGHHYALHILLSGPLAEPLRLRLAQRLDQLAHTPLLLCTHETPWQWEYAPASFIQIATAPQATVKEIIVEAPFVKLSCFWALNDYDSFMAQAPAVWQQVQPLLFSEM
jgi:hypothetical protein